MAKARLEAIEPSEGHVDFQYNPTKYQVQKALEWKPGDQKAANSPPLEFVQGKGRTVTMDLLMDDYEPKDEDGQEMEKVVDRVNKLIEFTLVDPKTNKDASKAHPPKVKFVWTNEYAAFPAVIKSLNITYTLFHENGRPARATVNLALQEWVDKKPGQNPTSMGSGDVRTHRVVAGETLDMIAYQELGAAHRWKYIAELNNLDNPLAIQPGQHLMIAPLR